MSNTVSVDDATFTQINLLARAWNVTPGQAVSKLIEHFQLPTAAQTSTTPTELVPVHTIYKGVRVEGQFHPVSRALSVTGGPAAGDYRTPSGAASAVLQALSATVKPNRNGWSFWTVTETGKPLQSLRQP